MLKTGVLALQGDFELHAKSLVRAGGVEVSEIRTPRELDDVSGLVIPGGESTTLTRLLKWSGLDTAIASRYESGTLAVFGTCMGMILVASEVVNYPDVFRFGFLDITVERNAYGRQVESFEADIDYMESEAPFRAVFIRAPQVRRIGGDVEIISTHDGLPVLMAQGNCLAGSFHPELTEDVRIHRFFVERFVTPLARHHAGVTG